MARGYLGIGIQNLTPDLAKWFEVEEGKGILVTEVTEDSAAEKAGLKQDDIIVEYDGKPVEEVGSFRSRVASTAPGTKVDMAVVRKGKRIEKTAILGTLPGELERTAAGGRPGEAPGKLGITVQNLSDELAERFGYEEQSGVVVTAVEPGSPAAAAGIQAGVLIQEVNREPVHNLRDFGAAMRETGDSVLLRISDGRMSHYIVIDLE